MSEHHVYKVKKGYILIYSLFLGFLILAISVTLLRFQLESNRRLQYKRIAMEAGISVSYKREKVFTELYNFLKEKTSISNKTVIAQYMKNNSSLINLSCEDLSLSYSVDRGLVMLIYPYNISKNSVEYYDVYPYRSGIKLNLVYSEFKTR